MPDLLNGISNTHFVPCFTKAFWVHGTRDNAFLTIGRKEVFWQQALKCLSFIPDSMWEEGGERERERRETLSSLSMILKMTIFQILFHYSEVFTDARLLGSNPYSVITSAFISSFHQPITHMHTNWSSAEYSKLLSVSGVWTVSPGILFPRLMKVKHKYQI